MHAYSIGSTVRLWDVNSEGKKHKNCIKPKSQQGRKIVPTACTYSNDGRWVAAACQDGSIQIWDHNKSFVRLLFNISLFLWMDGNQDTYYLAWKTCTLKTMYILYMYFYTQRPHIPQKKRKSVGTKDVCHNIMYIYLLHRWM